MSPDQKRKFPSFTHFWYIWESDGVCHLIKSSLSLLIQEHWSTLVEEDEQDVLEWAACVKQNLMVLCYLHHVKVRNVFTVVSCHKKKTEIKGVFTRFRL